MGLVCIVPVDMGITGGMELEGILHEFMEFGESTDELLEDS